MAFEADFIMSTVLEAFREAGTAGCLVIDTRVAGPSGPATTMIKETEGSSVAEKLTTLGIGKSEIRNPK